MVYTSHCAAPGTFNTSPEHWKGLLPSLCALIPHMALPWRSQAGPTALPTTDRSCQGASYLGTDVRYVRTLDTFSSGTSLKRALSGRVMIQALSFPLPPGKRQGCFPGPAFGEAQQQSPGAAGSSQHTLPWAQKFLTSPEQQNKAKSASEPKHNTQVQVLETNVPDTSFIY